MQVYKSLVACERRCKWVEAKGREREREGINCTSKSDCRLLLWPTFPGDTQSHLNSAVSPYQFKLLFGEKHSAPVTSFLSILHSSSLPMTIYASCSYKTLPQTLFFFLQTVILKPKPKEVAVNIKLNNLKTVCMWCLGHFRDYSVYV